MLHSIILGCSEWENHSRNSILSDLLREDRNTQLKQGLTNRHMISGYAEWSREGSVVILVQVLGNEEFAQSQAAELNFSQAMWYIQCELTTPPLCSASYQKYNISNSGYRS